ncbi:NAD(P)-dependent oxidoreductase [Photobacterium phosphoreum]|uniref:NAD-dependent epimerase/dehydratase family protein n=1 Tax=Photobacterium phosphoreum TaxID=659 RepID=UPI000D175570|nr:NAD(P)-dependent oxidoreductase [Photobacterium phosphoreum]PSW30356.1 NAD(P)-dependent oxidoreductase [Photobacterium phosphoreum]
MLNKNKVLVIGASGSLGSGLCNEINKKYNITATYLNNKIENKNVTWTNLDITDELSFNKLESDYDAVILIAGAMPATMKGYDKKKYFKVNVEGTLNVLEFCRKNKIKKIIYIMTFSDRYDDFYSGKPILDDGNYSLNYKGDHAIYSISKVSACELLEHYHQEYGLQTIIFRIPTVYCYDDKVDYYVDGIKKTKAYITMIRDVIHNNKIEIWGDSSAAKDMPYIKDFSNLISLAIEDDKAQGIYNAGTGKPVTLDSFVDSIIKVFSNGHKIEKIYKSNANSQPNFTFNMEKTCNTFGYEASYSCLDMLEDIKINLPSELLYDIK